MRDALNRTLLLMKTHLVDNVGEEELLAALQKTVVVITADASATTSHSGQSAIVAAAMSMARAGHKVWLAFEDAPLKGPQPPLTGRGLLAGLIEVGEDLLPGWQFNVGWPQGEADLIACFGQVAVDFSAGHKVALQGTDWTAEINPLQEAGPWEGDEWPIGGLACGALAAGEAFKVSMRRLASHAQSPQNYNLTFASCARASIEFAPAATPLIKDFGRFDIISAGAIANSLLFSLLRVPGATGLARVFDDDESAESNLNRNALLRRSRLDIKKVDDLASFSGGLIIEAADLRYGRTPEDEVLLAPKVLVGVDDIPSRWKVQRNAHEWLGVGATDRFSVQVSYHCPGVACVGCLHPEDTPMDGAIPTVAFVSFWSGLLLAVQFLRALANSPPAVSEQQAYFSPLRPESWMFSAAGVARRADCPVCGGERKSYEA